MFLGGLVVEKGDRQPPEVVLRGGGKMERYHTRPIASWVGRKTGVGGKRG